MCRLPQTTLIGKYLKRGSQEPALACDSFFKSKAAQPCVQISQKENMEQTVYFLAWGEHFDYFTKRGRCVEQLPLLYWGTIFIESNIAICGGLFFTKQIS